MINIIRGEGCRNCDFIYLYHGQCYTPYIREWLCKCENFEPKDNLKYLEMKSEEKDDQ